MNPMNTHDAEPRLHSTGLKIRHATLVSGRTPIARLYSTKERGDDPECADADARLLRSAPETLIALENLYFAIENAEGAERIAEALRAAADAIEVATGSVL